MTFNVSAFNTNAPRFTISDAYRHFAKAKNDHSLDAMFRGLEKKLLTIECAEPERTYLYNNIYSISKNR